MTFFRASRARRAATLLVVAAGALGVYLLWRTPRQSAPETAAAPPSPAVEAAATGQVRQAHGLPRFVGAGSPRPEEHEQEASALTQQFAIALGAITNCWDAKICPAGSTCWMGDDERLGCYASNCGPDRPCPQDQVCEAIDRRQGVRRCVSGGQAAEGAYCQPAEYAPPALSCAAGTMCWRTRCRRRCEPSGRCDGRRSCIQVSPGDWSCVPSCTEDGDCDKLGYLCAALVPGGPRTCVLPAEGKACRPEGTDTAGLPTCPAGQRCDAALYEDVLVASCRRACDDKTRCPAGERCAVDQAGTSGVCVRGCDPRAPHCAPTEVCVAVDAQRGEWACRYRASADHPGVHVALGKGHFSDAVAEPQ